MTVWERLERFYHEMTWLIGPKHSGDYGWLIFIGFFILAFICRKEFGGFFKAVWSLFWFAVFLLFLQSIHPALLVGVLSIGVIAMVGSKGLGIVMKITLWVVIVGAICLAVYQNLMV